MIEIEKTYYKRFFAFLAEIEPELNIEEDVDKHIYDLDQISERYEQTETKNCLNYYILPLVAVYKALLDQLSAKEAMELIEQFVLNEIAKRSEKTYLVKGILGRITGGSDKMLFRELDARKEGWKLTWLYNTKKETACNVGKCLINDILNELECGCLMPIVCGAEYLLMEKIHNGLFSRVHCIGQGDEYCDFVFEEK